MDKIDERLLHGILATLISHAFISDTLEKIIVAIIMAALSTLVSHCVQWALKKIFPKS